MAIVISLVLAFAASVQTMSFEKYDRMSVETDCDYKSHYTQSNETHIWCCNACRLGYRLTSACQFGNRSSTQCAPCETGTYNDRPYTGTRKCLQCKHCNSDFNIEINTPCDKTRDTTCRPKQGYYCSNGISVDCHFAHKQRQNCDRGHYISTHANNHSDIHCAICPQGSWSVDGIKCIPHTICKHRGDFLIKDGTAFIDNVCGTPYHYMIVTTIFVINIASVLFCIHYMAKIIKFKKD
ncbi:Tumor necrosis factor receptor superfamily [Scale drop disease virus]|uniref:ORF_123L n=1 Tax=Scale drop disease virus TaxID=1697349 RepID=A0A0K1L701_9VIRU|nr:ORF_123L [Scale drop disease virus]AKU37538.1 ORF_123L [Scale drop disease virus]QLI60659.1 Tumor necrosis factor receptor superfamily [Scale drop disease virus]QXJ13576.1 ORF123L [Scale drop disease virus]UNH60796.1 Tumor necrosis factor receptor superfamily [Scale drop disease virus]